MFLRKRPQDPNLTLSIGCLALCAANIAHYAIPRWGALSESTTDGLIGFLFGVAISMMLISLYRRTRSLSGGNEVAS